MVVICPRGQGLDSAYVCEIITPRRSQKLSQALVETNKATSLRRNESEYSPRTCSIGRPAGGVSPTFNLTCGVDELDMLLWQLSSNIRFFFVRAILLLLSIEPTTPVPSRVASQWRERPSYNGDHNGSEMAGAPPVGRRARTTWTTPSKYVRTALLCGAHSSSRILVPPVGCWARTTQRTPSEYVRTTLLFGAHSSSRSLVASVHRQLFIDHSAVELPEPHPSDLFAPRSASMLHSTSPRVASTNPKIGHRLVLFFAFWGSEAYARHATDKHTGINPSNDLRRGLRLLREPIYQHTPLLSEPDRPSRDPLGLRAPCSRSSCRGSFLVIAGSR